jgi:hypothetical protein
MKHAELNFIEVYIHRKVLDLYIFFLLWSTWSLEGGFTE